MVTARNTGGEGAPGPGALGGIHKTAKPGERESVGGVMVEIAQWWGDATRAMVILATVKAPGVIQRLPTTWAALLVIAAIFGAGGATGFVFHDNRDLPETVARLEAVAGNYEAMQAEVTGLSVQVENASVERREVINEVRRLRCEVRAVLADLDATDLERICGGI